ncbi:hypothetical protein D3C75_975710 [compost metagenome]
MEALVTEQARGFATAVQPGLPAFLGDQFDPVAAGGDFDFEGVFDVELEVERERRIVGDHDIAHINVLPWPNAIGQRPGVLAGRHFQWVGGAQLVGKVQIVVAHGRDQVSGRFPTHTFCRHLPEKGITRNVIE